MLLVQKPHTPHTLNFSQSPLHTHRRHPSAPPTVVVLPTRTPGLLTLSKPPRPPLRQNQRQTTKPLSKSTPVARAPLPSPPVKVTDNKKSGVTALPATPSPQPRGRGQVKHTKDRVQNQRWFGFFWWTWFFFCHLGWQYVNYLVLLAVENMDVNILQFPNYNYNRFPRGLRPP